MSNYYDRTINSLLADLEREMEISKTIKFYENIFHNGNDESKRRFSCMSFLTDLNHEEAEAWVKKAIKDFDTNEVFLPLVMMDDLYEASEVKAFVIKVYRKMLQKKRKAKLEPVVTTDELMHELSTILTNN